MIIKKNCTNGGLIAICNHFLATAEWNRRLNIKIVMSWLWKKSEEKCSYLLAKDGFWIDLLCFTKQPKIISKFFFNCFIRSSDFMRKAVYGKKRRTKWHYFPTFFLTLFWVGAMNFLLPVSPISSLLTHFLVISSSCSPSILFGRPCIM